jgi:ComF family protein
MFKDYLFSFLNLLFPNYCVACDTALAGNEDTICTSCIANLPVTNFWNYSDNPVEKIFWGRVLVENAASFVYFEKGGSFQNLLHHLKYKGKKNIGFLLGRTFGLKLINTKFEDIDIIIPVPLHKSRLHKRGFNQSETIAIGLGKTLKKPVNTNLVKRSVATNTQTNKNRFDRWQNVENAFIVINPKYLQNKHILIVDDVITTGATSESLIQELIKIKDVKVSFVALASA